MKAPSKDIGDEILCLPIGLIILGTVVWLFLRGTINAVTLTGGYMLAATFISLHFACILEDRLRNKTPGARTYGWGYFSGCIALAGAPVSLIGLLVVLRIALVGHWKLFGEFIIFYIPVGINAVTGWFVIRRRRWAWVLGTILTGNPVLWVANYFYGKKRWNELN